VPRKKPTMYDRQEGAHRVAFESQDEDDNSGRFRQPPRLPHKRRADAISEVEENTEVSEDEGFQSAQEAPPPKRARVSYEQKSQRPQQPQRTTLQRADSGDDNGTPQPTYEEAHETAILLTARMAKTKTQTRTPWSPHDTNHLIDMIAIYGGNWSTIQKVGGFERDVDQVGLKDKARNIKVDFLKSGGFLPKNFDCVALGAKEKAKVKAVGMNPYRREGEIPGGESHDMDGELL